ncbi:hypothetical protein EAI69_23890, partial [Escherichia coli]
MNRRLIVQFDPDEPSMSAPTFAEPDQGPLAGGRKVNARHDLTLGLWRRDGTVAKLAMRQPFVLFKGLTFQKLCLPGA